MLKYLLTLLVGCSLQVCQASESPRDYQSGIVQAALSLNLAGHPTWHKLLHYEAAVIAPGGVKSAIHSKTFFLDPAGHVDPERELLATIRALFEATGSDSNLHAQCRFRARYIWLKKSLGIESIELPEVACPRFNEWSMGGTTDSISIVFATGFLGNPASYYGHTLIKLNSKKQRGADLLDVSVNYGAIVPEGEDPVSYMIKGLIGGYEAGFSHIQYYFHTHNYGENELRDLWEYELQLDPEDVVFVLAHAWEVLGNKYTYYFLEKNCAYRMGEIIQILDGVDIVPGNRAWVIPQMMMKKIGAAEYKGRPLVRGIKYYPSRQSQLYAKYEKLTPHQKSLTQATARDLRLLDAPLFVNESLASQQNMLDTLLDYYQFSRDAESDKEGSANESYRKVLARRYQLPPGVDDDVGPIPRAPHSGRNSSLTQVGIINNADRGAGQSLLIRPAYYDVLDASHGHVRNAALTMGEIQLVHFSDGVNIRRVEVVGIHSVKSRATGLPGDHNRSWKLKFGWESQNLRCETNCLVTRAQGDVGRTWMIGNQLLLGAYLGGAIQDNRNGEGNVYAKATGLAVIDWQNDIKSSIEYESRRHADGYLRGENVLKVSARYFPGGEASRWDVRLSYERNRGEEFSALLGYYW